jgi:hypothetical protein
MTMAAQLGCTELIYMHHLTPLLQLVLHFLDWLYAIFLYNGIMGITRVSKTNNDLLVIHL